LQIFNVVQQIYQFVTLDPNPENWNQQVSPMVENGSVGYLNLILGGLASIALVSIMFTFAQVSMKRTFYMVGY
jgi:hypothetical protein